MISTFTSARATRWAGGVLVVVTSAIGVGIAGPITIAAAVTAAPTVVTLSPASATIAAGGCAAFTAHATTPSTSNPGAPADTQPIMVQVTQTVAPGSAQTLSVSNCMPTTVPASYTVVGNGVVAGSAGLPPIIPAGNGTATLRFYGTTDANGNYPFAISSTLVGSVSVVAYYQVNGTANAAPTASDHSSSTATVTVVAGGAAAVSKLTVSPASATQYVGSSVTYTVKTTDANGVPIGGIEVDYVMSGVDTQAPVHQCGVHTAADGTANCAITNGGTAGTDTITFYVNGSGGTSGPDSGEPQATATTVFQPLPGSGTFTVAATCSNTRIAGPISGNTCSNSTATHAVTFTATVTNTSGGAPASGVLVSWGRASSVGDTTLSSPSCTTATNGTCSITLNEPSPAGGETQALIASVGSSTSPTATAGWQSPTASYFKASPPLQTVTNGGAVNLTASVLDQFGAGVANQSVSFVVSSGRDAGRSGTSGSGTTAANGTATFGYTDTAPTSTTPTDTVDFTDHSTLTSPTPPTVPSSTFRATVNYISGSTQAGAIALDLSGNCNTTSPTSTNSNAAGTGTIKVCALVTNASGTKLLGKPVTFAVSIGKVDSTTPQTGGAGPAVTVDTDSNGVATAYVSSTTVGTQTVTANADAVSASGTVGYTTSAGNAYSVKIAPATTQFAPGASQTFTATVTDVHGNAVAGTSLLFVTSGPGTIGGGSNQLLITAANGSASVVLTTVASDSGAGTVTASVQNDTATQCHATGGVCTAVASYTVKTGAGQAGVLLFPQKNVVAGSSAAEGIEVVTLNADGTVAPNVLVRLTISGANNGTGAVTTNASGAAVFPYAANNAGTDTISAYEDLNNNQTKDAGEPSATATATIYPAGSNPGGGGSKEHPALVVTQKHSNSHQEKLTLTVTSHPALAGATVTFYQVKKGHRQKIGPGTTGSKGKVTGTLKAAHGLTLKFQVKVKGKAGVKSGYSKVVTVHVK